MALRRALLTRFGRLFSFGGGEQPLENAPVARSGLVGRLYGWPPPALDPGRDTAWLDGLRGIAAWLVVAYHYNLVMFDFFLEAPYGAEHRGASEPHGLEIWRLPYVRLLMCAGHAQVSVFFVLSGFVLSWSPLGSIRRGQGEKLAQTLASSTFRRWLRLYLPCFAIGLISVVEVRLDLVEYFGGRKDTLLQQMWDYLRACERFADPLRIDRPPDAFRHDYNWTMWTIPYEFAGSLLVFLILLSVSRIRDYPRRTIVIASIVLYTLLKARWAYWLFTTGLLLADYIRERGGFVETSRPLPWVMLVVISLWLAGIPEHSPFYDRPGFDFIDKFTPSNWHEVEGGGRFWWCWSGILFTVSGCHLLTIRRLLATPAMRYLGRISYMLYITHRIVYEVIGAPFRKTFLLPMMTKKHNDVTTFDYYVATPPVAIFSFIVYWILMAPLAIFVGHWCEVLVDGPSVRLTKLVDQWFVDGLGTDAVVADEEMVHLTAQEEPGIANRESRIA